MTVPVVVEHDEDWVWCAHAQLRPGVGAHGDGDTEDAALKDLREALTGLIEEFPSSPGVVNCRGCLMPRLPSVSGIRVVRALERHGFKVARVSGSHHIMRRAAGRGTVPCTVAVTSPRAHCAASSTTSAGRSTSLLPRVGVTPLPPARRAPRGSRNAFVRLYEHAGQLMGWADRAEPEPHSHCSGANRDATGRTPTRPLAPLSLRHPPQRRLTDSIREQNRRCVP